MIQHQEEVDNRDMEKEQEFIKGIFGESKGNSKPKLTRVREVALPSRVQNKRRVVDFHDFTDLVDYYEITHYLEADDIEMYHHNITERLKSQRYQENDIIFIGSVHEGEQEKNGFAVLVKKRGKMVFEIAEQPDMLMTKRMYYVRAVESINDFWSHTFGDKLINDDSINDLIMADKYD